MPLRSIHIEQKRPALRHNGRFRLCAGYKPGGTMRGVTGDFRIVHAGSVVMGLIHCSDCGSLLQVSGSSEDVKRLGCPKHPTGDCDRVIRVVAGALLAIPTWLGSLMAALATEKWAADIYAGRQQSPSVPRNEIRRRTG